MKNKTVKDIIKIVEGTYFVLDELEGTEVGSMEFRTTEKRILKDTIIKNIKEYENNSSRTRGK